MREQGISVLRCATLMAACLLVFAMPASAEPVAAARGPRLAGPATDRAVDPSVPAAPAAYVTDGPGLLSAAQRERTERLLRAFEAETSAQVIVYIAERLPPGTTLEDYALRCFNQWGVGQAKKNNGVVLFIFSGDRRLRIAVGFGLETALPDAECKRIIDSAIVPEFKRGHYGAGIEAGLREMLARIRQASRAKA